MATAPYYRDTRVYVTGTAMSSRRYQNGYKNSGYERTIARPYVTNLGRVKEWQTSIYTGSNYYNPPDPTSTTIHSQDRLPNGAGWTSCRNKAYAKLKENVFGTSSQLGTFAAEWQQSFGMIANRAIGLRQAYSDLRKGNFRSALNRLSVKPKRKHRNVVRTGAEEASGLWLEYWFGWAPSLNDIYTSCQQLSEELPQNVPYFGRAHDTAFQDDGQQSILWNFRCEMGCRVSLENPNLFLLNQLGLLNPASVAWEVIPFSFLADWCFDISSYINSFSDFAGTTISSPYTTNVSRADWRFKVINIFPGYYRADQLFMVRKDELTRPLPNADILANLGVSKARAASAVSLLTQILSK